MEVSDPTLEKLVAKRKAIEIVVDSRILRIGHEVYQLSNIARVSTYEVRANKRSGRAFAIVCLLAAVAFLAYARSDQSLSGTTNIASLINIAILVIVASGFWILVSFRPRKKLYVLLIESSGVVHGVIGSQRRQDIVEVKNFIVDAMQEPPPGPISYTFHGDYVEGDKIEQSGLANIGKLVR